MTDRTLEGAFYSYIYGEELAHPEWNRRMLEFYVEHFADSQHVLDVGCGQGQFIELMGAQGIKASGIDSDVQMVTVCQEKGLDVVNADLFDYLREQKEQFDGLFSSNVIEHLTIQDALRFFEMAFAALRPGGVLLVATPNPESLIVHLHEFWRDATHVRLYSRSLLEFLLFWAGFRDIQSGENSRTEWEPPAELQAVPKLLENLTSWERCSRPGGSTFLESVIEPKVPERERMGWRRLALLLRRRLARFVVQTLLFEEFAAIEAAVAEINVHTLALEKLEAALETVSGTSRQMGQALYEAQTRVLTIPREVFAKGVKPRAARVSK